MLMIYIELMSEKHTAPKSNGELLQKWMNSVVAPAFVENQDNPYNYIKILNTGETDTGETEKIANFMENFETEKDFQILICDDGT